jgi:hypothetical protein
MDRLFHLVMDSIQSWPQARLQDPVRGPGTVDVRPALLR